MLVHKHTGKQDGGNEPKEKQQRYRFVEELNLRIGVQSPVGRYTILYANVMPWLGILATYLFYFVDRHWYHRLLMGSILHGGSIEQKYADEIPELALGAKISEQSPVELKNWLARKVADLVASDERWVENSSTQRPTISCDK